MSKNIFLFKHKSFLSFLNIFVLSFAINLFASEPLPAHTNQFPDRIVVMNLADLIEVSEASVAWEIGFLNLTRAGFSMGIRVLDVKTRLFNILSTFKDPEFQENWEHEMHDGMELPAILAAWHRNNFSCAVLIKKAIAFFDSAREPLVRSDAEREVFKAILRTIFEPETYAKTHTVKSDAFSKIAHARALCEKHERETGEKTVLCLTGLCHPEAQKTFEKKFPKLFNLFDHVVLSGRVKVLLAGREIYFARIQKVVCAEYMSRRDKDDIDDIRAPLECCSVVSSQDFERDEELREHSALTTHACTDVSPLFVNSTFALSEPTVDSVSVQLVQRPSRSHDASFGAGVFAATLLGVALVTS